MTYADYKSKYGEVIKDGKAYALREDAYPEGGSWTDDDGWTHSGDWYEASATDAEENEYIIRWTRVDWEAEDGGDACDWNNPDYITAI